MSEIERFVLDYLKHHGDVPPTPAFNYVDSGLVDSLGVMRFVSEIEERFDIELTDEEIVSDDFRVIGGLLVIIAAAQKRALNTEDAA